ncbi:MAG: hypothetical protein ACOYNL_06270 [Rickettsiales bacterium]
MQPITVSTETIKALLPYHQLFQAGIMYLAHKKLHVQPPDLYWSAGFYQGGVQINGRRIIINPDNVVDAELLNYDHKSKVPPTKEEIAAVEAERAVADAIHAIVLEFEKKGPEELACYSKIKFGGSLLNSFFNQRIPTTEVNPFVGFGSR